MLEKILKVLKSKQVVGATLTIISLVALIAVNFLLSGMSYKLDFSRGKAYTLSPGSKKYLSNLKKNTDIYFFVSSSLPSKYTPVKSEVSDLLKEIKAASSKITIKEIDPKNDQSVKKLVSEMGIAEMQFPMAENDQFSISTGYFALGIKYDGKTEKVENIDLQNFEYNLISKLYKLSSSTLPKVGFLSNFPVAAFSQTSGQQAPSFETLKSILASQFEVVQLDASADIAKDVKAVLAFEDTPYTDAYTDTLKKYLTGGGKAILFADTIKIDTLLASTSEGRLKNVAADYGIKIEPNLVLSAQSSIVNFSTPDGQRAVAQYPYWFIAQTFAQDSNYFYNVPAVVFPWGSSLTFIKKDGIKNGALVKTTPQSWADTKLDNITINSVQDKQPTEFKQYSVLGMAVDQKTKSEVFVIPSSRFVQDAYLNSQSTGNIDLITNIIFDAASDGSLNGIRSRNISLVPLPPLSAQNKNFFKGFNILFLPALLGVFGLVKLYKRK